MDVAIPSLNRMRSNWRQRTTNSKYCSHSIFDILHQYFSNIYLSKVVKCTGVIKNICYFLQSCYVPLIIVKCVLLFYNTLLLGVDVTIEYSCTGIHNLVQGSDLIIVLTFKPSPTDCRCSRLE